MNDNVKISFAIGCNLTLSQTQEVIVLIDNNPNFGATTTDEKSWNATHKGSFGDYKIRYSKDLKRYTIVAVL